MKCPVNCKYCMAQYINSRANYYNNGGRISINKTCVAINRDINDKPLKEMNIPWNLLVGEYIGFQGATDCFNPVYYDDLLWLLNNINNFKIRKLVLCTKMQIPEDFLILIKKLNLENSIVFIISTTGLDKFENTTTSSRIDNIRLLKKYELDVLPAIHPYIHGVSDISFLNELSEIGIKYITWKGFRYNPIMNLDIPKSILCRYINTNEEEILIGEEYLVEMTKLNNLSYIDMKDYVTKDDGKQSLISKEEAEMQLKELSKFALFSTSSTKEEVLKYRISSRIKNYLR